MNPIRRRLLLGSLAGALPHATFAAGVPEQVPAYGRIERIGAFASRFVDARPVEVWLPPGYNGTRPHAVLYMHDGQMMFDARIMQNHQSLAVDSVAAPLLAQGLLRDFIIVAPWNNGTLRMAEYYPKAFLEHLFPTGLREGLVVDDMQGRPLSDAYLRFLVDELKPAIDARYATAPGRESTFVMGVSLGALVSLYALCEYSRVFGGAACMSTHLIGIYRANDDFPDAVLAYLKSALPDPATVRLYMDRGTLDLDGNYVRAQARVDALLAQEGYKPPGFVSRVFEGAGHNLQSWHQRLEAPLRFLLAR